jgi:GST-like protein
MFADMMRPAPFLSGAQPGAVDFLAAVVSKWSGTRAHLQKKRPGFFSLLQRIESHERVAPVFREHWDA